MGIRLDSCVRSVELWTVTKCLQTARLESQHTSHFVRKPANFPGRQGREGLRSNPPQPRQALVPPERPMFWFHQRTLGGKPQISRNKSRVMEPYYVGCVCFWSYGQLAENVMRNNEWYTANRQRYMLSITDSAERTTPKVSSDIPITTSLGPVARDCDCNFINRWRVPAALIIAALVYCELDRHIFASTFLENLQSA